MSVRGKLLKFIGIAIGLIIVISLLWNFVAPAYNHFLVGITNRLTSTYITLGDDNSTIYFSVLIGGTPFTAWIYSWGLHYGLILVIALIGATPGIKLVQRLYFILIALVIMLVIHIVSILIMASLIQPSGAGPPLLHKNPAIILFFEIGSALFPALVWGGFSLKYWRLKS